MTTASPATSSVTATPSSVPDAAAPWPIGVLLRDIVAGGVAGIVAGIVVAGIGGRIVMRLAALLVPAATGLTTENGNRIGTITANETAALILFEGVFIGMTGGVLWVIIRPWMPRRLLPRLLLAAVVTVAFGTFALIEGTNPDFFILRHSPAVVALLVGLVALFGPAVGLLEWLLDRSLPRAGGGSKAIVPYALVAAAGLLLALPLVVQGLLAGWLRPLGIAIAVTGIATLAWWAVRARGAAAPPRPLLVLGRAALAASMAIGLWFAVPEISAALGARARP